MGRIPIPEVTIVPLVPVATSGESLPIPSEDGMDPRKQQVEEFLQTRSLSKNSQKAYRQDLQHFLTWTQTPWGEVTPKQIAQYKHHLMRTNPETGQRVLSDASVRRALGTLHNFCKWMQTAGYLDRVPTITVEKPKAKEPDAQSLSGEEIEAILQATTHSNLSERNLALVMILLHGLKASEVCGLDQQHYDGHSLQIRGTKGKQSNQVPLNSIAQDALNIYLEWRQTQGETLHPDSPLFVSHSHRNQGQRIGYDAIRKMIGSIEQSTGLALNTHQFRHTFVTDLILKGTPLQKAMDLTRHQSKQNLQRYTKARCLKNC